MNMLTILLLNGLFIKVVAVAVAVNDDTFVMIVFYVKLDLI